MWINRSSLGRWLPASLVLVGGGLLSLWAFFLVRDLEGRRRQIEFERQAHELVNQVRYAFDHQESVAFGIRTFFQSNLQFTPRMFQTFATDLLNREPSMVALAWAPRTPDGRTADGKKEVWPEASRDSGFTPPAQPGPAFAARKPSEHFPILCVEPTAGHGLMPGADVRGDENGKKAAKLARATGALTVAICPAASGAADVPSFICFYIPVYTGGTTPSTLRERQVKLRGFVCEVIDMDQVMEPTQPVAGSLATPFRLYGPKDEGEVPALRLLYASGERPSVPRRSFFRFISPDEPPLTFSEAFAVADQRWRLECDSPGTSWRTEYRWFPWVVLLGGFTIAGLLANHLVQRAKAEAMVRRYQRELQSLVAQVVSTEERERQRIASNLHDRVSQDLAAAMMRLTLMRESTHDGTLGDELRNLEKAIGQVLDNSRSLTSELSPPVLYELGLEPAIEWVAAQMRKRFGLEIRIQCDGQPKPLDEQIRNVLFHATCELLTNVAKHARTRSATVWVARDGPEIRISVSDGGLGFDVAALKSNYATRDGFGLFNIRERMQNLGGHFLIDSTPGQGTIATLIAPLKPGKPQDS